VSEVSNPIANLTEESPRQSLLVPGLILLAACFLLGLYCCSLNKQLYQHQAPFYDSLSYNEKLFRVMTLSRESGFVASMERACFANNTNCLPFIVAATVAPVVEPSRMVGVWIQTVLLYLFLASLLYYLIRVKRLSVNSGLMGCLAFLGTKCLYFSNGGLSDFRMDLSLYLGFGMTCVWYLASMRSLKRWHFVMLGVSAAVCCLFRATAPIYFLFTLCPLYVLELIRSDGRKEKLTGLLVSFGVVLILAGWFYFFNFEFLKFYYFDWNTDANAKIPFAQALLHWEQAQRSVGEPMVLMILCWMIGVLMAVRKSSSIFSWIRNAFADRDIDFRIAWIGIAPVTLMVAKRAGLNPYVSMPAVFGLMLFFAFPCLRQFDRLADKRLIYFSWLMLVLCLGFAAFRGWDRHSRSEFNSMAAHRDVISAMLESAANQNKTELRYGVTQITDFDANILYSTLLFDNPDANPGFDDVEIDGIKIRRVATFAQPAVTDWRNVEGETDEQKMAWLVADANERIDYLVVPDRETAKRIAVNRAHNVINVHAVRIRELIVNDDSWARVKTGIEAGGNEFLEIYRNTRRP